jgi:hypothetical protein
MGPLYDPRMFTEDLSFRSDDNSLRVDPHADRPIGEGGRHAVTVTLQVNETGRRHALGMHRSRKSWPLSPRISQRTIMVQDDICPSKSCHTAPIRSSLERCVAPGPAIPCSRPHVAYLDPAGALSPPRLRAQRHPDPRLAHALFDIYFVISLAHRRLIRHINCRNERRP